MLYLIKDTRSKIKSAFSNYNSYKDLMNILVVGGDAELKKESFNALHLTFGDGVGLESAPSLKAVRRELQLGDYNIVLDLGLPNKARWQLLHLVRKLDPLVQVIVVFESDQEDLLADALRQGADEAVARNQVYPALLPFIVERAYERYLLLEQRRQPSRQTFDLEALDEFTSAVAQAMDLGKAMDQARTALHEIDILLEKSREELTKRRVMLREAGSEVQHRERGLEALSDLTEAVSSSPDLESILTHVLEQALSMTTAEAGAVLIIEEENKPIRLAVQKRLSDALVTALSGRWPDMKKFMTFLVSGQTMLVQNLGHSDAPPELTTLLLEEGFTSMIGVPLQAGGNLLGGLMITTRHAEKLTERDARWLGVLGQQAGIAIENARLRTEIWEAAENWFRQSVAPPSPPENSQESQAEIEIEHLAQTLKETKQQLRKREDALSAIINITSAVSYQPDVLLILQEILHHTLEESEAGGIWILDELSTTLTLAAQAGLPENLRRSWSQQEWEQDSFMNSLMSGEFVYLDDASSQSSGNGVTSRLKDAGARVVMGIPIQIQEKNAGAMIVIALERGQLQARDAELFTVIGQQLGQVLERQGLQDNIRRLALELTALREQQPEEEKHPFQMLAALQQMAEQVQHREEQFAALYQISQLTVQNQVLKTGLTTALRTLGAQAGLVLQRDSAQDHFTLTHQESLPGAIVDKWALRPLEIQECFSLDLLQGSQIINLNAGMPEPPAFIDDLFKDGTVQTIIVKPLNLQWENDDPTALLMLLFSPKQKAEQVKPPLPLTKTDLQWLNLVAQMMALSLVPAKTKAAQPN